MADALRSTLADTVSAGVAAACVSPFVVAVDKAIAENASGKAKLWTSFFGSVREAISTPVHFLRQPPFRYLTALFGGTYLAANLFASMNEVRPKLSHPLLTATGVFATNSMLSLWKDSAFARMFSTIAPKPVPWSSLCSWWARDFIGMTTIFVLPPLLAKELNEKQLVHSRERASLISQIALPLAIQPVVSPFHLLGYVLYNQDAGASTTTLLAAMRKGTSGDLTQSKCTSRLRPLESPPQHRAAWHDRHEADPGLPSLFHRNRHQSEAAHGHEADEGEGASLEPPE